MEPGGSELPLCESRREVAFSLDKLPNGSQHRECCEGLALLPDTAMLSALALFCPLSRMMYHLQTVK
jgi:hypothetical protein